MKSGCKNYLKVTRLTSKVEKYSSITKIESHL